MFKKIKEILLSSGFLKYLKNTGWALSSKVVSMGVAFISTIVIARELGPTNFGELSYAISFISIFSFLASLGIDYVLYRELIQQRERRHELLGTAFILKFISGTITTLFCSLFAFFIANEDISKILIIILSTTFFFSSFQVVNHEFQAVVASKYPAIISFITVVTINIVKVLLVINEKGVIYISFTLVLEQILLSFLFLYFYQKKLNEDIYKWSFSFMVAKNLIKDSWPLIFSSAFLLIYSKIDQIFIKHMIDAKSVGIYDAAVRIAEVWYFLPNIIIAALFPAIVNAKNNSEQSYNKRLGALFLILLSMAIALAIPITLFAPQIITTLYGNEFTSASGVLRVYTWASIGVFLGALISSYLVAENNKKALIFTSLIPMIINVILNLMWIPDYGITGAAYATLISYLFIPISSLLIKSTRNKIYFFYNIRKN